MFEGVSLRALLNPESTSQKLQTMLEALADGGLASTSWQEGQPELTIANVVSELQSEQDKIIAQVVRGLYFRKAVAAGDKEAAYALAESYFDESPKRATRAQYVATITNSAGVAFPNRPVGSFQAETPGGAILANTEVFSLAGTPGATVDVPMQADIAGTAGNASPLQINIMAPLAGTDVSFLLTAPARDDEPLVQLETRCLNKLGQLVVTGDFPNGGYAYLATKADDSVSRTRIDNSPGRASNAFDVYIAAATGAITDPAVTFAVRRYLEERQAPNADLQVKTASVQTIDVEGFARVPSSLLTNALKDDIRSALSAYLRTLPIGGASGLDNTLPKSELITLISGFPGIEQVVLSNPATDVALGTFSVLVPVDDTFPRLTFEAI